MNIWRLRGIDEKLFDAAVNPGSWVDLMEEISQAGGSAGAVLLQTDVRTPDVLRTPGVVDDMMQRYFRDHWQDRDLRVATLPRLCRDGIGVDQDFASPEVINKNPYYAELFEPFGLRWLPESWCGRGLRCGLSVCSEP